LPRRVARPESGQLWGSATGTQVSPSSRPPAESMCGGRILPRTCPGTPSRAVLVALGR
jgi:hypothetical protein